MPFLPLLAKFWYIIPIALLALSTAYYKHDASKQHEKFVAVQAEYDNFKARVEQLGKAQEEQNKLTIANQQKAANDTAKSYESRLAIINAEYARLRDRKSNSGERPVPPDATAAKPANDTARDDELLRVLRQAQVQTEQLIEFQEWQKAVHQ